MPEARLVVRLARVRSRVEGAFVRVWVVGAEAARPVRHDFPLREGEARELRWSELRLGAAAELAWEVCRRASAPEEEGGEEEPVICGGCTSALSGRAELELADFYSDEGETVATATAELEGLPPLPRPRRRADLTASASARAEAYYAAARPATAGDRAMRVPSFRFYGGELQASYVSLVRGGADEAFAASALAAVLAEAGSGAREFAAGCAAQRASPGRWLPETAALAARLGELCTLTGNLMRYRADLSSPAARRPGRLIEKIVPHVREEGAGDCEDTASEICSFFGAVAGLSSARAPELRAAAWLAARYVPFAVTAVATAAAAGSEPGAGEGEMLHVFACALARRRLRSRLPERYAAALEAGDPWEDELPHLLPLEGTNWCDPLHLPLEVGYGADAADVAAAAALAALERRALRLAPALKGSGGLRIRQRVGAALDERGFSGFYRRATELWSPEFADLGACCWSPVCEAPAAAFGVSAWRLAADDPGWSLVPVFEHSPAELAAARDALGAAAPVPAWSGEMRPIAVPELAALAGDPSARPRRASRLRADAVVFRFRSLALARSPRVLAALRALRAEFRLAHDAWALPPDGRLAYVAVYAKLRATA